MSFFPIVPNTPSENHGIRKIENRRKGPGEGLDGKIGGGLASSTGPPRSGAGGGGPPVGGRKSPNRSDHAEGSQVPSTPTSVLVHFPGRGSELSLINISEPTRRRGI